METITGKITSSTPVTIFKAASIISKFVSAETGASQAICAYLRRANAAFDELARVHAKSDRRKQNRHKSKKTQIEEINAEKLSHFGNPVDNSEVKVLSNGEGIDRKKHKKQEGEIEIGLVAGYKENGSEVVGNEGEDEGTIIKVGKKKRKNEEVAKKKDDGSEKKEDKGTAIIKEEGKKKSNTEEVAGKKDKIIIKEEGKKKKRKNEEVAENKDDEGTIIVKEEGKKKRKSEEVAEKGEDGSEEKQRKKKRRRSGEGSVE